MSSNNAVVWIIIMCVVVLGIVLLKNKIEILLNFVLRAIFGAVGLYCLNMLLAGQGLTMTVGINPITVSAIGVLGVPGVALLYGISLYNTL